MYGFNTYIERRSLWQDLNNVNASISGKPGYCSGDFNVILNSTEGNGGDCSWNTGMQDLMDCLILNGLVDLKYFGERLSWWNSSFDDPIYRKLDQVVVNGEWLGCFALSYAHFLLRLLSDHAPTSVCLGIDWKRVSKPFQFFHHLLYHPEFLQVVQDAWSTPVFGDPWFVLSSKLKKS